MDWPGWCRGGKEESLALQALFDYAPRYARVLARAELHFELPGDVSALSVVERLPGNSSTDYGVPDASPSSDSDPVSEADLGHFQVLLEACWGILDAMAEAARGKALRLGPRGGGRDLEQITRHVREAEISYLSRLGWKVAQGEETDPFAVRQAVLDGLVARAHGEIEERGPRGGLRWTPRYFVRRAAWHILDHAWEIEDRSG
jgi:hypothetical protein